MNYLWRIELFGGLRAVFNQVSTGQSTPLIIERFRTHKTACLLAYLAIYPKPHAREVLVELLWPEQDPKTGSQNLRTALSSLRRQFEPPGVAEGSVLLTSRTKIQLNPQSIITDAGEFSAAIRDAKSAFDDAFAVENYERAVSLYGGRFLPGYYEDWAMSEAECFATGYFAALQQLIKHYEAQNDITRALHYAQLGSRFPDAPDEISEALERFGSLLHETSSASTSRVLAGDKRPRNARLVSQSVAEKTHSAKLSGRESGEVSQHDAPTPESAPLKAQQVADPRTSLPPQFTRFFGREPEMAKIHDEFENASTRLLTLTGAGGAGKTRLAIEAARRLRETLSSPGPAEICFVALADIRAPVLVATSIINALDLPHANEVLQPREATSEVLPIERLIHALQARPTLLILDNFEHLAEAASLLETLLMRVPHLKILVTSQQRLYVAGERELPVTALPTPQGDEEFEALLASPSVQLFVDRAQLARADFQITRHNADDIARLCVALEGVPLAIELAAARAGVLSAGQIAAQLEAMREAESGRLDFLRHPRRPATPRHLSLRTAINWSYGLLTPELAGFWSRLAVFRGSFTPEAAQAVCEQSGALHLLGQLRACSLLAVEERDAQIRFRWSALLHEFARDQLEALPDKHEVHRRHAEHLCDLLADVLLRLRTPDEVRALAQAAAEADNARAALEWTQNHNEYSLTSTLSLVLGTTLQRLGLHREALDRFKSGLQAIAQLPETYDALRMELLRETAGVHLDLMEWGESRQSADLLHELSRRMGDRKGLAEAANLRGLAAKSARKWQSARKYFAQALKAFEELEDTAGRANVHNNLGLIEYLDGKGDKGVSKSHLHQALSLRWELNDVRGVAEAFVNLGALAQQHQDLDEAGRYYLEALGMEARLNHAFGVGRALCNLGEVVEESGDIERAFRLYVAAQSLFEISGAAYCEYTATRSENLAAQVNGAAALRQAAAEMARHNEIEALIAWSSP
jgi:predicted ATPase